MKGDFFDTKDCVAALTAAHVLYALQGDASAAAMSAATNRSEEEEKPFVPNQYSEVADSFFEEKGLNIQTRDDLCRWARTDQDYKDAAALVKEKCILKPAHAHFALFKPTAEPRGFSVPFMKRDGSETGWGLAIVTGLGAYDNRPKALPNDVREEWSEWTSPQKGDRVFKYGITTKLTEGVINLDPDQKTFAVDGSRKKVLSGRRLRIRSIFHRQRRQLQTCGHTLSRRHAQ